MHLEESNKMVKLLFDDLKGELCDNSFLINAGLINNGVTAAAESDFMKSLLLRRIGSLTY
jgi:hypothetical protein